MTPGNFFTPGPWSLCLPSTLFSPKTYYSFKKNLVTLVMLKLSTNAQGSWQIRQLRIQSDTRSSRSSVIWRSKSPSKTPAPVGNMIRLISDLGRALCPWLSCRNRSRRWRSARLPRMRAWWAALPAFSGGRDVETLKFLQRAILQVPPSVMHWSQGNDRGIEETFPFTPSATMTAR